MPRVPDSLPDDVDALKAALIKTRAKLSGATALIEHLQLVTAKMKREHFGPRWERNQRLLDQMELHCNRRHAAVIPERLHASSARLARRKIVKSFVPEA
jgi:transposase